MRKLLKEWKHFLNEEEVINEMCGCQDHDAMDHHDHEEDHESDMARRQMFKTAEYAVEVFDMLQGRQDLPAWIQSKMTKIADYMGVVKHYLEYDEVMGVSEGMKFHIDNKRPITENIYRLGSDSYFKLIKEAKDLNEKGEYTFSAEEEEFINENPDLGEWAFHEEEDQMVPLDFPMYIEASQELFEKKKAKKKEKGPIGKPMKNTGGGKKYKVYVKDPKSGNVRTITYGDSKGGLKGNWNSAEARASFASRHNCAEKSKKPNRRLTAGYWACRAHKDFGKNVPGRFW